MMNKIDLPKTRNEYIAFAMKHYDTSNYISFASFKEDLRLISKIQRYMVKYRTGSSVNLRELVNMFLIACNQFSNGASTLILSKLSNQEDIDNACLMLSFLGRRDQLVEKFHVSTNEELLNQLYEI